MAVMGESIEIEILHFNDVYHMSDLDLVPRFASVLSDPRHVVSAGSSVTRHQLRVFSGDAFSPSLEASVLRGDHMTELLSVLGIDVACYGNHDFDFGEARLADLSKRTNFPWTLANAVRKDAEQDQSRFLAEAQEYAIKEIAGCKIGFFGLAGTDWSSNCQHLPSCDILDPVWVGQKLAARLRSLERCDIVIAVTHMRLVEDMSLAKATASGSCKIDLILGGHDHHIVRRTATDNEPKPSILQPGAASGDAVWSEFNGLVRIIKSGTDWKGLSIARLTIRYGAHTDAVISDMSVRQITDLRKMPEYHRIPKCPKTLGALTAVHQKIEQLVQQPLLYTDVSLDGRSTAIRCQESNLGNMIADAVRAFCGTDIALVNSGSIRCDRVIEPSANRPLRIRDLVDISPFDNAMVVKRVSGRVLAAALENSVSDAHTDGRFMQLSGLRIYMDWNLAEGHRVTAIRHHPRHGAAPDVLDLDRLYTVAMTNFIATGFDGYSCFENTDTIVDTEGAMTDTNLLLEVFGGAFTSRDKIGGEVNDATTAGIARAREAVIKRYNESDGLPVIQPRLEGRIEVLSGPNL